jgi:hypothetical protein
VSTLFGEIKREMDRKWVTRREQTSSVVVGEGEMINTSS